MIDLIGKKVKYERYDSEKHNNVIQQGTLVHYGVNSIENRGHVYIFTSAIVLLPNGSFSNIDIRKVSLVDPLEIENG